MELSEMVAIIENYPDATQRFLHETLKEILYRKKGPVKIQPCPELDDIISTGIIEPDGALYAISEPAKKRIRKLYTYLVRKYDTYGTFDPETRQIISLPKGSEFVATVSLDGSSSLVLQFPDDEVTDLLNLYGTNPCDKWTWK